MADREINNQDIDASEVPELLQQILRYTLKEGCEIMESGHDVIPFTAMIVKENVILEEHPGENADQCFASAEHTVKGARGATGYAFCYDGYLDTDKGRKDALIVEGGLPGDDRGFAIGRIYEIDADGKPVFDEKPILIGTAPNYMKDLVEEPETASDADIDTLEAFENKQLDAEALAVEQDADL